MKLTKNHIPVILGALTLLLFGAKPYILDLIEPSKSIGRLIGENAKDLINAIEGDQILVQDNVSKRQVWSNLLTISGFVFFGATLLFSSNVVGNLSSKWYRVIGAILAILGFALFILYLGLGLIGFVVVSILIVLIVLGGNYG